MRRWRRPWSWRPRRPSRSWTRRRLGEVVGVEHLPAERAVARGQAVGDEVGELPRGSVLPEDDRAGVLHGGGDRASVAGNEFASATDPAVVGRPATSMLSFTRIGTPASGPRSSPARGRRRPRRPARGVVGQLADRVERGPADVERGDALQVGLDQVDRGEVTGREPGPASLDGGGGQVEAGDGADDLVVGGRGGGRAGGGGASATDVTASAASPATTETARGGGGRVVQWHGGAPRGECERPSRSDHSLEPVRWPSRYVPGSNPGTGLGATRRPSRR